MEVGAGMSDNPNTTGLPDGKDMLLVREVAASYRLSSATIYRAIRLRELPALHFGNQFRLKRAEVEAWIESKRTDKPEGVAA